MGKRLFWIDRKMMALWNYMCNMFVMPTDAKKRTESLGRMRLEHLRLDFEKTHFMK